MHLLKLKTGSVKFLGEEIYEPEYEEIVVPLASHLGVKDLYLGVESLGRGFRRPTTEIVQNRAQAVNKLRGAERIRYEIFNIPEQSRNYRQSVKVLSYISNSRLHLLSERMNKNLMQF